MLVQRAIGSMLGVALGDMLGLPNEGRSSSPVPVSEFDPARAAVSDDTQLTIVIAEELIEGEGEIDGARLGRRLVAWLPHAVGIGAGTLAAVVRLRDGCDWREAGTAAAGNGAAMRVAPIGLVHAGAEHIQRVSEAATLSTHRDDTAVLSAAIMAAGVSWLSRRSTPWDPHDFVSAIERTTEGLPDPLMRRDRRPDAPLVHLRDEIGDVLDELDLDPVDYFARRYSGGYVVESLPAALWCFLRCPNDPEEAIRLAVEMARDSDTVGAMTGALVGAWNGADQLPRQWIEWMPSGLCEELTRLATELADLAAVME